MNRLSAAVLLLGMTGCTADFFVGPDAGGSSSSEGTGESGSSPGTTAAPSTTADGTSTTQGPTTQEPDSTTSSTTDETTTTASETRGDTELSTGSTTDSATGETEAPGDCVAKEAAACEEAFPTCLWNGEECTVNLCDVGGQIECLTEAPECIWEARGCIPSGCGDEAECSPLVPAICGKAKGCQLIGEMCFSLACVPCAEVVDIVVCDELPNCAYNEGREVCLPQ